MLIPLKGRQKLTLAPNTVLLPLHRSVSDSDHSCLLLPKNPYPYITRTEYGCAIGIHSLPCVQSIWQLSSLYLNTYLLRTEPPSDLDLPLLHPAQDLPFRQDQAPPNVYHDGHQHALLSLPLHLEPSGLNCQDVQMGQEMLTGEGVEETD